MMVILCRSRLTDSAGDDYSRMSDAMSAHARTFLGFIDVKSFTAADGERLTVMWWRDEGNAEGVGHGCEAPRGAAG